MRTKITTCIVVSLMLIGVTGQAQKRNRAEKKQKTMIQLTDAQKEELKAAKIEFAKATIDVRNELNELKAHQKTLMSAEKLDEKKIFENIDDLTVLRKQLAEERIEMRLATSELLGDKKQEMRRRMRANRTKMQQHRMNNGQGQQANARGKMSGKRGKLGANNNLDVSNNQNQGVHRGNRKASGNMGRQNNMNLLDLSDNQQKQMELIKLESRKETQNLREEMQELRLKQKHLLNDEVPNKNEIFSNLDQISKIQNQLAKENVNKQKEIRKVLDKDQLVLFLSKQCQKRKNRKVRM